MKNLHTFEEFLFESINSMLSRFSEEEPYTVNGMDDYIEKLKIDGAKNFSGGSSAEVLKDPKGGVIKIYSPKNDPGMTRFLSFCIENPRNPLVPKIKKIKRVRATEEDRWIIAIWIEELKTSPKKFKDDIDKVLRSEELPDIQHNRSNDDLLFTKMKEVIQKYSKAKPGNLEDVLAFLKGHIKKYPEMIDFGSRNWMFRGSQIVLIDPFYPGLEDE
jgi:hemerythrin